MIAQRRGLILPTILVIIGLLALTMAGFIFFVRAEIAGINAASDAQQARLAAESGLEEVIATLRLARHDAAAWHDVPARFRHALVWGASFDRQSDPLREGVARREYFANLQVRPGAWRFSVVASSPEGPEGTMRFGITPESGRLNLHPGASTDQQVEQLLGVLLAELGEQNPQELINAILDWRDEDDEAREGGAEDEYYNTLSPPYRCKNGALDSIEELLLVKGVNAAILYGEDVNRNGILDENEDDAEASFPEYDNGDGALNQGLAPFLTTWSRDLDRANDFKPRINLNLPKEQILQQIEQFTKPGEISDSAIDFILSLKDQGFQFAALRSPAELCQGAVDPPDPAGAGGVGGRPGDPSGGANPGANPGGAPDRRGGARPAESDSPAEGETSRSGRSGRSGRDDGGGARSEGAGPPGRAEDVPKSAGRQQSREERGGLPRAGSAGEGQGLELAPEREGAAADADGDGDGSAQPSGEGGEGSVALDAAARAALAQSTITPQEMPALMDRFSTRPPTDAMRPIVGLININVAPRRVLAVIPNITPEAAIAIADARGQLDPAQLATTAWPVALGLLSPKDFAQIAPFITTQSYVFHVEVLGYADHTQLARRFEWIIEMIGPIAQIRYHRDLTRLGQAWPIDDETVVVSQ